MKKSPKVAEISECKLCDYKCSKRSDYNKHLTTAKHKNRTNLNNLEQKVAENRQTYVCKYCDKVYYARNSLWYHEQKCNNSKIEEKEEEEESPEISKELILSILKQNCDLQNTIIEQNKTIVELSKNAQTNNSHNTTNSNNNSNNKFNLQFFLNETCKDAMNITEFVDSIKLQLEDLISVGELGYVEGISNIITKNLKALDVTQRPIHCTDKKREVLYVKDEDKWEKEDESKKKVRKVIKKVADKNARMILKYKEVYPDYRKSTSKCSDQYNKIIVESFGNDLEKENKIIKNITKATTINQLL
jgi:hypothetical protein